MIAYSVVITDFMLGRKIASTRVVVNIDVAVRHFSFALPPVKIVASAMWKPVWKHSTNFAELLRRD